MIDKAREKLKLYFFQVFQTVLEIIEDKPNFLMSKKIYCILMTVNIFQISGYIFCTGYDKLQLDIKFIFLGHVNEVSTGTLLLLLRGIDNLTLIFFILIQLIVYSYTIYVLILNYIKNYQREFYENNKKFFQNTNQLLTVFFTLYYWIFLTPFTEIGLGILSCNQDAFLVEFRDNGNCDLKPTIWIALGVIAVVLSVTTNILICFFFRNYEFCDSNLLKRKFAFVQIPISFAFFALQFLYYINNYNPALKFIAAQVMGLSMIYDIVFNYPYRNSIISTFHIIGTSFFWVSHTMMAVWLYDEQYYGTEFFYTFCFCTCFLAFLLKQIQIYYYHSLISADQSDYSRQIEQIDFYLEEIWLTSELSMQSDSLKFKIIEILTSHKQTCVNSDCECKVNSMMNDKNQIEIQFVDKLIECIFIECVKSRKVTKNQTIREHLYLKYITYIAKFQRNPLRAYFLLKSFNHRFHKVSSSYFKVICQVLMKKFEDQILSNQKLLFSQYDKNTLLNTKTNLSIKEIVETDLIAHVIVPQFASFVKQRSLFWQNIQSDKTSSVESIRSQAHQLYNKYLILRKSFSKQFNSYSSDLSIKYNYKLLKIYRVISYNEVNKPLQIEKDLIQLTQKCSSRPQLEFHSFNLLNGHIQTIQSSFSKDIGKILTKPTVSQANFFEYDYAQYREIRNIKSLIPSYIANIHETLMHNFIQRGYSLLLQTTQRTLAKSQEGFLFPLHIQLSLVYGLLDDLRINATFLKQINNTGFIAFNQAGQIKGISKDLYQLFFLSDQENEEEENPITQKQSSANYDTKLKQEFQKFSIFTLIPSLLKVVKEYLIDVEATSNNQKVNLQSEQSIKYEGLQKMHVLRKKQIKIAIPNNLIEMNQQLEKERSLFEEGQRKLTASNIQASIPSQGNYSIQLLSLFQIFLKSYKEEWEDHRVKKQFVGVSNLISFEISSFLSSNNKIQAQSMSNHLFEHQKEYIFELDISEIESLNQMINQRRRKTQKPIKLHPPFLQNLNTIIPVDNSHNTFSEYQPNNTLTTFNDVNTQTGQTERQTKKNEEEMDKIHVNRSRFESIDNSVTLSELQSHPIHPSYFHEESQVKQDVERSNKIMQNLHQIELQQSQSISQSIEGITSPTHFQFASPRELEQTGDFDQRNNLENQLHSPHLEQHGNITHNLIQLSVEKKQPCDEYQTINYENQTINQIVFSSNSIINSHKRFSIQMINQSPSEKMEAITTPSLKCQLRSTVEKFQQSSINYSHYRPINLSSPTLSFIKGQAAAVFPREQVVKLDQQLLSNPLNSPTSIAQDKNHNNIKLFTVIKNRIKHIFNSNEAVSQLGNSFSLNQEKKQSNTETLFNSNTNFNSKQIALVSQQKNAYSNNKRNTDTQDKMNNLDGINSHKQNSTDNEKENLIIHSIINSKSFFSQQLITFLLFVIIIAFIILSVVFFVILSDYIEQFKSDINHCQQLSLSEQLFSQQLIEQLVEYESRLKILPPSLSGGIYNLANNQCEQVFIDYSQQFKNIQSELILTTDSTIDLTSQLSEVAQFSLGKQQSMSIKYADLVYLNLFQMQGVCEYQQKRNQISRDSLYFMHANQVTNYNLNEQILKNLISFQENRINDLTQNLTNYIIIISTVFFSFNLLTIPQLRKINKFQEVILLVVARATYGEIYNEIDRFDQQAQLLNNIEEKWVSSNFCQSQTAEEQINSRSKSFAKIKSHILYNGVSKINHSRQMQYALQKQKQQLNTQITSTQLPIWNYILQNSLMSLIAIVFFAIIFILSRHYQNLVIPKFQIYKETLFSISDFRSMVTTSEILHRGNIILNADNSFPTFNIESIKSQFTSSLSQIQVYTNYMSNTLEKTSILSQGDQEQLISLVIGDLCLIYTADDICSPDSTSLFTQQIKKGFISVLSSYSTFFNDFQVLLIQNSNSYQQIKLQEKYAETDFYREMIAESFQIPGTTFQMILQTTYDILYNQINDLTIFFIRFFIIGGVIVIILWFILILHIKRKIDLDIASVSFSLTCIPLKQAQEEATTYLLKQIYHY